MIHLVFFFYEKGEHFKNALKHFYLNIYKKMFTLLGALRVPGNTSQYCCKSELAKNVLTIEEQRPLDVCT